MNQPKKICKKKLENQILPIKQIFQNKSLAIWNLGQIELPKKEFRMWFFQSWIILLNSNQIISKISNNDYLNLKDDRNFVLEFQILKQKIDKFLIKNLSSLFIFLQDNLNPQSNSDCPKTFLSQIIKSLMRQNIFS